MGLKEGQGLVYCPGIKRGGGLFTRGQVEVLTTHNKIYIELNKNTKK